MEKYDTFTRFRQEMNKKILEQGNLGIRRFFALDEQVYKPGALDGKTKELMGLTASSTYGGVGADTVSYVLAVSEISRVPGGMADWSRSRPISRAESRSTL